MDRPLEEMIGHRGTVKRTDAGVLTGTGFSTVVCLGVTGEESAIVTTTGGMECTGRYIGHGESIIGPFATVTVVSVSGDVEVHGYKARNYQEA